MARKSRTQITKQLAERIVHKLKAVDVTEPGDEHDEYEVYDGDNLVAEFGIRRGSRKGSGHDYIPKALRVGPNFAKQLGLCPKSRDDYLEKIRPPSQE